MTNRSQRKVRLSHLSHRDRRLHASRNTRLIDEVLKRQGVHHRAEHAHVVSARTLKTLARQLRAAEEVTAADDDRNLHALAHGRRDLLSDVTNDLRIQADRSTSERLSRQLEQNAAVRRHDASPL